MSEAVTDPQADRLLLSVRQIVGDNGRGRSNTLENGSRDPASQASSTTDAHISPFVLTSQFRVNRLPVLKLTEAQAVTRPAVPRDPAAEPQARADVQDLLAKITALEAALARTVKKWETAEEPKRLSAPLDVPSIPERAKPTESAKVHHLVSSRGAQHVTGGQPPNVVQREGHGDQASSPVSQEPSVIDHQALRTLVADIVRAELCGEGSGLVARQMRSLIRQEVRRALASERRA